ncbi:artemin [Periophthalmus magnuspinnatus]|nr:artemin [Periophthalmus magnuspinnatus]
MTQRSGWRGEGARRRQRRESAERHTAAPGGTSWRVRTRGRQEVASVMSAKAKVLLLVLLSLLPAMGGASVIGSSGGAGGESGPAVGLHQGPEERQLPLPLPGAPDEEQEEEDNDPDPAWHNLYDPYVVDEMDDHPSLRWTGRSPRSSDPSDPQAKGSAKRKKKKKEEDAEETAGGRRRGRGSKAPKHSSRDCRVERRQMKVRDLGLGYDSDEIILFKYCVGSCQSSRTTYDLALKALLHNGSLPRRTARKVSSHPCCRPDRYESVSFMDTHTTWQTIDSLSAASCMCMG